MLHTKVLQGHSTQLMQKQCRSCGTKAIQTSCQCQPYEERNKNVFKHRRKVRRDGASLTLAGRLFHACEAATGNARSPSDGRRVDETSCVDVAAERRQHRPLTSEVRWSISARYDGAVSWRQRYARTHNRNCIRSGTRNQWSSESRGVMCSDFLAEKISRAAALRTDCSRSRSWPDTPARTALQ